MRSIFASFVVLLSLIGNVSAQQKTNPITQINWPLITGNGVPTISCSPIYYGMSYQNTAVTPNTRYHCAADGWELEGTGGGGVTSINSTTGAFTFTGAGVSCTTTTCTFTGGTGSGIVNYGTGGQIAYYPANGTAVSGESTVSITQGGTGAATAVQALVNLGTEQIAQGGTSAATEAGAQANLGVIGPTYNVMSSTFGCVGNGVTDDTACIQAAFNACHTTANGAGVVQFPAGHTYLISATINTFQRCPIEGSPIGNDPVSDYSLLPRISWNAATSSVGVVSTFTSYTIAPNTSYTSAAFPSGESTTNTVTFNGVSPLPTVNQWIEVSGLSTMQGLGLDRAIMQVASVSGSSFVALLPYQIGTLILNASPCTGSLPCSVTENGSATTVSVVFASDGAYSYGQSVSNIQIAPAVLSGSSSTLFNVGIYYGAYIDTGSNISRVQVSNATEYSYYFATGGMNTKFDGGWRSDGARVSAIYWRGNFGSLALLNGTVDNYTTSGNSGGMILLDGGSCTSITHLHIQDIKVELNSSVITDSVWGLPLGAITMYPCPSKDNPINGSIYSPGNEFTIEGNTFWVAPGPITNGTVFSMIPENDNALNLNLASVTIPSAYNTNSWSIFRGLPQLNRELLVNGVNPTKTMGYFPLLTYAPSYNSINTGAYGYANNITPDQLVGDLNIAQLWQHGIPASAFLYADTAFAALPNGTTLYAGQVLAPPSYWYKANGKRYGLDVVYAAGTTGTLNSGSTTCTTGTTVNNLYRFLCSSGSGLSVGQFVTLGGNAAMVWDVDETTSPVTVYVSAWATAVTTASTLSFTAPLLGPEIQLPTKSSSAPSTLAWTQGDMEQNSGATANGVAAWVNVASGTPGTWAGIPLGNSSGQINVAQISTKSGTGSNVLTDTGASATNLSSTGLTVYGTCGFTFKGANSFGGGSYSECIVPFALTNTSGTNVQTVTVSLSSSGQPWINVTGTITLSSQAGNTLTEIDRYAFAGDTVGGITITKKDQQLATTTSSSNISVGAATVGTTYFSFPVSNSLSTGNVISGQVRVEFDGFYGADETIAIGSAFSGTPTAAPWYVLSSAQLANAPFQSLTTTGTSGPATLSGGVLNIPQYAGGGSMTWPAAPGIMVYAGGSAYGTSLTAPSVAIVGTTDTQTLTNKTLDGVTPTTMGYVDPTSSIQTQLNGKQASGSYALTTATTLSSLTTVAGGTFGTAAFTASSAYDVAGAAAARQANLSLLPGTYTNGDMCTYASTGTLLNCNTAIPSIGTWGALNYPTWTTGTPFVKMTAVGTFALDTNTYQTSFTSQTANYFFAAPNGSSGTPLFRAIVSADVPTLNQSTTGTAANLSGTPVLPNGTTATTQTAGDNSTKLATTAYVATAVSNAANANSTVTVSSGTQAANSCSSGTAVTLTGSNPTGAATPTGTGSLLQAGYQSSPSTLTGWGSTGGMVFHIWPTASTANSATWEVCNQTASSITYSAITFILGVK